MWTVLEMRLGAPRTLLYMTQRGRWPWRLAQSSTFMAARRRRSWGIPPESHNPFSPTLIRPKRQDAGVGATGQEAGPKGEAASASIGVPASVCLCTSVSGECQIGWTYVCLCLCVCLSLCVSMTVCVCLCMRVSVGARNALNQVIVF